MDIIKYRIWEESGKRYLKDGSAYLTMGGKLVTGGMHPVVMVEEAYLIELFIGRKDKNDVEIYEGDKIKASWGYGSYSLPIGTTVELSNYHYWEGESCIADDIEIIGNIHEIQPEV